MSATLWLLIGTVLDGLAALLRAVTPGAALVILAAVLALVAWRKGLRSLVCPLVAIATYSVGYDVGFATALHVTDWYSLVVMPAPAVVIFGGLAWLIHRYAPPSRR